MKKNNRGSIFVFALWTVFFVSVFAFYTARVANMKIEFLHRAEARMSLYRILDSGINQLSTKMKILSKEKNKLLFYKIVVPSVDEYIIEKDDDIVYKLSYNYSFEINKGSIFLKVSDSQSRLNLNTSKLKPLQRLIEEVVGLDHEKALALSYDIIDWRDKNNERPLLNVINNEDLVYKLAGVNYVPTNKKYKSIEELLLVNGMTVSIFEKLNPFITVFGSGSININTCSKKVLNAVIEDEEITQKIYSFRERYKDEDDIKQVFFTESKSIIRSLQKEMQLSDSQINMLDQLISKKVIGVDSSSFRVKGIAKYHTEKAYVDCVLNRTGMKMYYLQSF